MSRECFDCARFRQRHVLALYVWTDTMVTDRPLCEDCMAAWLAIELDQTCECESCMETRASVRIRAVTA